MNKKIYIIVVIIILLTFFRVEAQYPINSPYTRFGLGDISLTGFGMNSALGGTAIGLRSSNQINYLNPASYSAQDTLSFIFDFGLTGSIRNLYSEDEQMTYRNLNIDHIAVGFPITKWLGTSIGITSYSKVGYNILLEGTLNASEYQIFHEGNGGLNRFFIGSSVRIGNNFSIGGNLSYIFGSITRNKRVILLEGGSAETKYTDKMVLGDVLFSIGVQGFKTINNNSFVVGLTIDNETKINGEYTSFIYNQYLNIRDTIDYQENTKGSVLIPMRIGVGFSYNYKDKLLIAFDYITQDWTKADIFGSNESLSSSNSLRVGLQYTPVPLTQVIRSAYWKRIKFRIGGYYTDSYLKLNENQLNDFGMTFGVGLPWKNEKRLFANSSFNLSYQLGQRGSLENGLLKETYHILSVGFTLYDFWFIKPKYD